MAATRTVTIAIGSGPQARPTTSLMTAATARTASESAGAKNQTASRRAPQ